MTELNTTKKPENAVDFYYRYFQPILISLITAGILWQARISIKNDNRLAKLEVQMTHMQSTLEKMEEAQKNSFSPAQILSELRLRDQKINELERRINQLEK